MTTPKTSFTNTKTVYGPVKSWRFGLSLGIDPLFNTSICSFNCVYCQLGHIQLITNEIKEYVPTQKVLDDFKQAQEKHSVFDAITFSGSGEPTLASNLGDIHYQIKKLDPAANYHILTNGAHLKVPSVLQALKELDVVTVKLDAPNEALFKRINRPAEGVNFNDIVEGAISLPTSIKQKLEIQSMFMPMNQGEVEDFAKILKQIGPRKVHLNTPKRPYPLSWHRENRGNHELVFDYEVTELKVITPEQAKKIEQDLKTLTGLEVTSVYQ